MEIWEEKVVRFCITKNYLSPQHWDYLKEKKKEIQDQGEKKNLLEIFMEEFHWSLDHVQSLYNKAMEAEDDSLVDINNIETEEENAFTLVDFSLKKGPAKIITEEEMFRKNSLPSDILRKASNLVSSEAIANQFARAFSPQENIASSELQGIFSKASPLLSGDKMANQFSQALSSENRKLPQENIPAPISNPYDAIKEEPEATKEKMEATKELEELDSAKQESAPLPSVESKVKPSVPSLPPRPRPSKPKPSLPPKPRPLPETQGVDESFATAKVLISNKTKEKKKKPKKFRKILSLSLVLLLVGITVFLSYRVYSKGLWKILWKEKQEQAPEKPIQGFTFLRSFVYNTPVKSYTLKEYRHDMTGMEFVLLPEGTFWMGNDKGDSTEKPLHQVTLSAFLISKYEVTQTVWEKIMKNNDSFHKNPQNPVECITWEDCQKFCRRTGLKLPSESRWEYACRAMTRSLYYWGDSIDGSYVWYQANAKQSSHPVGSKKPNGFGLYDMSGNLWEWCQDGWSDNYLGSPKDGSARIPDDPKRVIRGGCFSYDAKFCSSSSRSWLPCEMQYKDVGFRVCAEIE